MEYIIIILASLIAAALTLFSGFGLGTILLPVFALFFPLDIAIGATAVVHLMNNLFKLILLGKHADFPVVLRFGIPAIFSAFAGAWLLLYVSDLDPVFVYTLGSKTYQVLPVKLIIAALMAVFAVLELPAAESRFTFDRKYLPVGGVLSGFFGGLSGHQGALRSAFLLRAGLKKEAFIATGVVIACIIDVSRLFVYRGRFEAALTGDAVYLLLAAVLAAFTGAFVGSRLLKKITMETVQKIVAVMLFLIAIGLAGGFI